MSGLISDTRTGVLLPDEGVPRYRGRG